jgi:hypothetical protein
MGLRSGESIIRYWYRYLPSSWEYDQLEEVRLPPCLMPCFRSPWANVRNNGRLLSK